MAKKDQVEEIISYVDANVLGKSNTIEQFIVGLDVVSKYISLKGPVDGTIKDYLKSLNDCASEILSLKAKGILLSTKVFYEASEKKFKKPAPKTKSKEVDSGCTSDHQRVYHYSTGC